MATKKYLRKHRKTRQKSTYRKNNKKIKLFVNLEELEEGKKPTI